MHTAAECYDGIEAEISHPDPLQQPHLATHCLETPTGGGFVENFSAECNSGIDCGYCETGNEHKVCISPVNVSKSQVGLQQHGPGPLEGRVCHSSNTGRESCRTEKEGRELPIASTPDLNLFNTSEEAQRELKRQSPTVGILPPAGCGKQAEDTDRLEAAIQEGQEAAPGEEASEQEAENCKARRREQETNSAELLPVSIDLEAPIMGQNLSSEGSSSETKECRQDGENTGKERVKDCRKLCDELCLDEGSPVPVSTPGEEPCPLIEGGDVIKGPGSPVPHRLIQGLHDGEPPPDTNSLEQNQETAVKDYAVEQECGLAPQTGCPGNCSEPDGVKELNVENTPEERSLSQDIPDVQTPGNSMEETCTETPLETMPNFGSRPVGSESGVTRGLSEDEDCSVQAVGGSTTEIFHPTQDGVHTEDAGYFEANEAAASSKEEKLDEQSNSKPDETMPDVDAALPLKLDKSCEQLDSEIGSELSHSLQTMETRGTGEEPNLEPSKDDIWLDPVAEATEGSQAKSEESRYSECNVGTDHLESEVAEASSLISGEVISAGEEDLQQTDISNNLRVEDEDPTQDGSEITQDERPSDERLEDVTLPLDGANLDVEPPFMNNRASREQSVDNLSTDNPKIPETVDGGLQSIIQGEQTPTALCPTSSLL